jgi:trehalose 6-phosphate phosphatase
MKYLLSRENIELLAQIAWSNVLLAFDFDGTLAPIVANRDEAEMRVGTAELFTTLCCMYPCAVISGRSQADVSARLNGAAVNHVLGNHGLEPGTELAEFRREVAQARVALQKVLAGCNGVEIEDKRYSLALHYRKSRQKRIARSAIHAAVSALPVRMRTVPGKLVVNVVPARAPSKGDALLHLRTVEQADMALYVGDDATDEDVFEIDQPGRLLAVRVGESKSSAAAYFIRNQREIDTLLIKLAAFRKGRTRK